MSSVVSIFVKLHEASKLQAPSKLIGIWEWGWAGLGWAGLAGLAALLHSGPSHPAHYLQLVQPSPLARAQAQGAAGWDHLLDQDPAPIKVPTKFRSFNSPLGFEIFDHKIISDCEQMVQFSYSLNMETSAIFPLRLYPQCFTMHCGPLELAIVRVAGC